MRSSDILIVDDEVGIRDLLSEILQDEGYTVALAENAEVAKALRNKVRPALVLLDIWMPDCDGITLLKEWDKAGQLNMPVVMMSGHASIDTAVEATKIGAADFLEKPIALQKLLTTVERCLKYGEARLNNQATLESLGKSEKIVELSRQIERIAKVKSPVLLTGEPGSGFELVARYFHQNNMPWVEPTKAEQLVDAPLELLQKANNGVLYLSEIGQYSRKIQQGLLFLLSKIDRYNVRLVCSCSRPLQELLVDPNSDPRFINALSNVMVNIPPLREHIEDVPLLAERILNELIENKQVKPVKIDELALELLCQHDWPGNIDQLKNVIKSLALTAEGGVITASQVGNVINLFSQAKPGIAEGFDFNLPLRELREQLEKRYFEYHIAQERGNMSKVALQVGLERTHLYRKLKQLGIQFSRRQMKAQK
ncbi:sigma-54-dependent transcriptional regulator [Neisseria sp. Ec49-e6-T10]|uniref:sigma-54-dependent transcriptional regulator n=1 Tax=Neisseria sp. Ec49-e6-T10 TaxID=3140744 RepID=UPI003EBCD60C